MKPLRLLACSVASAMLLSACGGGSIFIGDFDDDDDLFFEAPLNSGRSATMTVSGATESQLNGSYSSSDARVSSVLRFSGSPETCRFLFAGLLQQGVAASRIMDGEIRYVAGTNELATSFIMIDAREFRADGPAGATVDRGSNRVTYGSVVFRSTQNTSQTITVTGSIPLRDESRPSGC